MSLISRSNAVIKRSRHILVVESLAQSTNHVKTCPDRPAWRASIPYDNDMYLNRDHYSTVQGGLVQRPQIISLGSTAKRDGQTNNAWMASPSFSAEGDLPPLHQVFCGGRFTSSAPSLGRKKERKKEGRKNQVREHPCYLRHVGPKTSYVQTHHRPFLSSNSNTSEKKKEEEMGFYKHQERTT